MRLNLPLLARRILRIILRQIHPRPIVRHGTFLIRIDLRDEIIGYHLLIDRVWEEHLMRLIPMMHLDGRVCLDLGAHLGTYTLSLADRVGPQGRVIAVEPEPDNFALLEENVRRNRFGNVALLNSAVGFPSRQAVLSINTWNRGDHRLLAARSAAAPSSISVPVVTVDDLCGEVAPGAIAFAKIDTQGSEDEILTGMQRTIERNPDMIIQLELSPASERETGLPPSRTVRTLNDLGFAGWEIHQHRILPLQPAQIYDLMEHRPVDLILSRNPEALTVLLARAFPQLRLSAAELQSLPVPSV